MVASTVATCALPRRSVSLHARTDADENGSAASILPRFICTVAVNRSMLSETFSMSDTGTEVALYLAW